MLKQESKLKHATEPWDHNIIILIIMIIKKSYVYAQFFQQRQWKVSAVGLVGEWPWHVLHLYAWAIGGGNCVKLLIPFQGEKKKLLEMNVAPVWLALFKLVAVL